MLRRIREFNLKPREIRDYLDRFVIKQDEAKKVLTVALCDHYHHVRLALKTRRCANAITPSRTSSSSAPRASARPT